MPLMLQTTVPSAALGFFFTQIVSYHCLELFLSEFNIYISLYMGCTCGEWGVYSECSKRAACEELFNFWERVSFSGYPGAPELKHLPLNGQDHRRVLD